MFVTAASFSCKDVVSINFSQLFQVTMIWQNAIGKDRKIYRNGEPNFSGLLLGTRRSVFNVQKNEWLPFEILYAMASIIFHAIAYLQSDRQKIKMSTDLDLKLVPFQNSETVILVVQSVFITEWFLPYISLYDGSYMHKMVENSKSPFFLSWQLKLFTVTNSYRNFSLL